MSFLSITPPRSYEKHEGSAHLASFRIFAVSWFGLLLISRGLHNRRRPTDHLVQVGTCGHHRVHGVFLLDLKVDHRRAPRSTRRLDDVGYLTSPDDTMAGDSEGLGKLGEIGSDERRRRIA